MDPREGAGRLSSLAGTPLQIPRQTIMFTLRFGRDGRASLGYPDAETGRRVVRARKTACRRFKRRVFPFTPLERTSSRSRVSKPAAIWRFIVSNLPREDNLQIAQSLTPDLQAFLQRKSG